MPTLETHVLVALRKTQERCRFPPIGLPSSLARKGRKLTHKYCCRRASMSELMLLIWDLWLFSNSRSISSRWAFFMASMAVGKDMAISTRGSRRGGGVGRQDGQESMSAHC